MAYTHTPRLAPVTARDGVDTRKKDLNVACNVKQELACEDCGEFQAERLLIGVSGRIFRLCEECNRVAESAMFDREDSAYIEDSPEIITPLNELSEEDCDPGELEDDFPAEEPEEDFYDDEEEDYYD